MTALSFFTVPCFNCGGRGHVLIYEGGLPRSMACSRCGGKGSQTLLPDPWKPSPEKSEAGGK